MEDFDSWKSPARFAHIGRHKAETFGFKLTISFTRLWVPGSIWKRREDQSVSMQIGTHEQHRSADRIEQHLRTFVS